MNDKREESQNKKLKEREKGNKQKIKSKQNQKKVLVEIMMVDSVIC